MLQPLLAQIDRSSAPFIAGEFMPFVVFAIVAIKAFIISRRPSANPRSAWGLLLVALSWLTVCGAGLLYQGDGGLRMATVALALFAFVCVIVGDVLAVFGIIECRRQWVK